MKYMGWVSKFTYIHYISWFSPSLRLARSFYLFCPKSFNSPFPGSWEETVCGHTVPSILALSCWKTLTHTSWHWPEGHFCCSYPRWSHNAEAMPWLQETLTATGLTWPDLRNIQAQMSKCTDAGSLALRKDVHCEPNFKLNTSLLCMQQQQRRMWNRSWMAWILKGTAFRNGIP